MTIKTPPERLIKYYRCDNHSYDALKNNYLWAAYPLQFNDPFDCSERFWDLNSFTYEAILAQVPEEFQDCFNKQQSNFQRRRIFIELFSPGVICLNRPNRKDKDILWGYYTNQEGFAIEFNTTILTKEWSGAKLLQVSYLKDPKDVPKCSLENPNDYLLNWVSFKKEIWENEEEWRFVFHFDECNGYNPIFNLGDKKFRQKNYSPKAVCNLVLGYRFFQEQINNDRKLKRTSKVDSFIFTPDDNQFKWYVLSYVYQNGIDLFQIEVSEEFRIRKRKIEILNMSSSQVVIYRTDRIN